MRAAFLSDLHANIHALTAVQRFIATQQVDELVVLGDLVGYGASPGAVIDIAARQGWRVSLGSSDARVAFDLDGGNSRSGVSEQVLQWTREMLTREQMDFLRRLPVGGRMNTPLGRLRYFHGSPHDPDQKLDLLADDHTLEQLMKSLNARFLVVGGTHIPLFRRLDGGLIVDPGSVGLTLNREPGADVAIMDFSGPQALVTMHKIAYDFHAAAFDIQAWDLPPVIAEVIRSGKMG